MGMLEAKGTVKLDGDVAEREHTFHFQDTFNGDLEKAKAYLTQTHEGIKNVRVRQMVTRKSAVVKSAPKVIPAKPAANATAQTPAPEAGK